MVDEKVLEGQQWVNKTYGQVAGYERCPENGRTGWSTMWSLTMGLQHELGISPVVANFGPGTLSNLRAHGDVGFEEENANICNIVQYALFAKGYWGGSGDGTFTGTTASSVREMANDMGVGGSSPYKVVSPKLFKALLSMDAYILTVGGTEKIREIQRWLNGRYQHKSTFFFGPCDGHFSRNVQQALMKAIQYEVGIPEDQVNGYFGPGTKAGLRRNPVSEGSSGIFVRLFSAACVFNEPVEDTVTSFKDTFDAPLREFVRAFQLFSALEVTGRGDFRTWAQLLVSTGDPDRPASGCDTSRTITASRAAALRDAGYRYVGRYLQNAPGSNSRNKEIQPGELGDLFDHGLRLFPIWQYNARELSDFTFSNGFQDGLRAHARGLHYGFNRGTVIYFAVDYDATQAEIESNIIPYFNGIVSGLSNQGKRYVHGVYGSRNVCSQVTKATYARWSFVSGMSWGFSGNLGFPLPENWAFNQIKEFSFSAGGDSFPLDNDVHKPGTDAGQRSVNKEVEPSGDFVEYVQMLYELALAYGKGDPNQLVMEYIREDRYNDLQWRGLIGGIDEDFFAYANEHGAYLKREFKDSFSGHELGTEHLMATCNGHYVEPPPSNSKSVNRGDVAGWGGDLMTLYGEWRRDSDSYPSGYTYCMDKMAKIGVKSSFGFPDLIEDADGYLISQKIRAGTNIVDAVRQHYIDNGNLTRFQDYFDQRFSGTVSNTMFMARNMLTMQDDPIILAGRTYLIEKTGGVPTTLPSALLPETLDEFLKGFADTLLFRVGQESQARAAILDDRRNPAHD
ncbi:glycoside hydrolase domain-containing protein [Amycolatopsis aidingensis]|uniref:glycoside hydrolase domain-containing protein n=1 Tax=Amycolatopsis aidingensis TaxID=2842453 RepID=UPI001C0D4202|nr:glycoside hydrolase domain-containing protein [Amycolatopsis aidingensis]